MADPKVPTPPAAPAARPTPVAMRAVNLVRIGKNGEHKPGEPFFAPTETEAEWLVENGAAVRVEAKS